MQCPDGRSCLNEETCCPNKLGKYFCCPFSDAVCCSSLESCCPKGYKCDVVPNFCYSGNSTTPTVTKLTALENDHPSPRAAGSSTRCPDGGSCGDYQTCCLGKSGKYGCCPLPNAVCCSDHQSCCPEGYTCKVSTQQCTLGNHTVAMVKKLRAIQNDVPELQSAGKCREFVPELTD